MARTVGGRLFGVTPGDLGASPSIRDNHTENMSSSAAGRSATPKFRAGRAFHRNVLIEGLGQALTQKQVGRGGKIRAAGRAGR